MNFDRGGRSGGNFRGGGGRPGGGGFRGRDSNRRDSGRREMHDAVCDNCGNDCKVPFRPSGDKPIYCSDCFEAKNGGGRPQRDNARAGGGDNSNKELLVQITAVNAKLERILRVLEGGAKPESKTKQKEAPKPKKEVKKAPVKKTVAKAKKSSPKAKKTSSK